MLENTNLVERRTELISQAKSRKLSVVEVEELKILLEREASHSFATGEIGWLAFVILEAIIKNLPYGDLWKVKNSYSTSP